MNDKPYHHGNLREALLNTAAEQISTEGAGSLNLSKLARAVGVSQPAVYRHFANKQDLAISLGIYGYHRMGAEIDAKLAGLGESAPKLTIMKAHAEAYVTFVLENRELARLMFSLEERAKFEPLYDASKSIAKTLYELVHLAHQNGHLQNGDVDTTVRVIWSSIHGLAMLLMDDQLPRVTSSQDQIEILVHETVRVLVAGLFSGGLE